MKMRSLDVVSVLLAHGVKPTSNRILVLRTLAESPFPLSMKDFADRVVSLDKSSIFRCLRHFVECHLVHEVEDGTGAVKYEICRADHSAGKSDLHPHFYCESCKRTICLSDVPLPVVEMTDGSVVHSANYVLKGVCGDCVKLNGK